MKAPQEPDRPVSESRWGLNTAIAVLLVNDHTDSIESARMSPIKLLNNAQTAELIGVRPNTLEIWRIQGKGPAYRKVGRLVRYVEAEVFSWLDDQVRQNTSQMPPHRSAI